MTLLGVVVLVGSVVAYLLYWEAFVSVWCFFAAAASSVILFYSEQFRAVCASTAPSRDAIAASGVRTAAGGDAAFDVLQPNGPPLESRPAPMHAGGLEAGSKRG